MQCPRCYFDNPADARVCEYCGTDLSGGAETTEALGGTSAKKRQTMLGEAPSLAALATPRAQPPAIDPDDPFRVAARGIVGGAAAEPPAAPVAAPAPQRGHRATIVEGAPQMQVAEVVGVLLVFPPEGSPHSVVLRAGRTRIGRAPDNDLVLEDGRVSSDHAVLRVEGDRAWLLDTSSNGTLVSGIRYVNDKADLTDDAVLLFGRTSVVVKLVSREALLLLTTPSE